MAERLIAWADVVVENFGPGYMERIGLDWQTLQDLRPGIILASVSVAGRTGPMAGFRGYGNSAAAWSGHCDMTGWPGSEPHMPPFAYGDVVAPMMLTVAILSALEHRDTTGQGVWVDVSQIEAMVQVAGDLFAEPPADKPANDDPELHPHGVAGIDWDAILVADTDQAVIDRWQAIVAAFFARHDRKTLADWSLDHGWGLSPIIRLAEVPDSPQMRARGVFDADGLPGPLFAVHQGRAT